MNATPSRRGTVTTGNAGRRGRRPLPYLAIVVLTAATALFTPLSAQASTAHPLMISFTFDDGFADEVPGQQLLHDHNMAGTFYINSGSIGQPGYMTRTTGRSRGTGERDRRPHRDPPRSINVVR